MNAIVLRGTEAEIRHGYHRAARLGSWTLASGRLNAQLVQQDGFRLQQSPLSLTVKRGSAIWTWRVVDVVAMGRELSATVVDDHA